MDKDLLINPSTKAHIESFLSRPMHALLLSGPTGSGKYFTAQRISEQLLGLGSGKLASYPYFLHIRPEKNSIGIDAIRNLQNFLQLKTTGPKDGIKRVVIIENAHLMTQEAQNSLLKSLEEPPGDSVMILTAVPSRKLLPTIYSRVQQIPVKSIDKTSASVYFNTNIDQYYELSGGRTGLLSALVSEADHPLTASIEDSKKMLGLSRYNRLVYLNQLTGDKVALKSLLAAMKQIAKAGLLRASQKNNQTDIKNWLRVLSESHLAEQRLDLAVNTRLIVSDLLLHM